MQKCFKSFSLQTNDDSKGAHGYTPHKGSKVGVCKLGLL